MLAIKYLRHIFLSIGKPKIAQLFFSVYHVKEIVTIYIMRNSDFHTCIFFSDFQIVTELLSFDTANNYVMTEFNLIKQICVDHLLFYKALCER